LLIPDARGICHDTASIARFRLASVPYKRGVSLLGQNQVDEARLAFAAAQRYFPSYPGLLEVANLAEERHKASVLAVQVGEESRALVVSGEFQEALDLLDDFLARYGEFGDYDFRGRAKALRLMFKHLELARAHRNAGANVSALVEFSRGVGSVPELKTFYPEYDDLRQQVLARLAARADEAYLAGAHEVLLEVYADVKRLRLLGSKALYRIGTAHEGLGNLDEATRSYEAIDLDAEEYVEGRRNLAGMALNRADLMQAKINLYEARRIDPQNSQVAADYAEVLRLMEDYVVAIAVWNEVAAMQPDDPVPYEMIARIEEERENWKQAGQANREAVRRFQSPQPRLLWRIAQDFLNADMSRHAVAAYVDLLVIVEANEGVSWLGADPGQVVRNQIRDLGFVHHMGQWIPKDQFLSQQGWELFNNEWVRPEEAQLREVAFLHARIEEDYLRSSSDSHYEEMAAKKRILLGMNRREVIQAWGFFQDQNVFSARAGDTVFEQLLFENARQVYLRDGLVCFWTE
jgi:tetratricopeptide (TPR) repeat protein